MTTAIQNDMRDDGARRNAEALVNVTVIIVSWNVAELLADCLESLAREANALSLEAIVVDNASADHTVDMLRTRFPWVCTIANRDNPGFACGNNQAIGLARGRHVLLLNPDTVVEEGALRKLLDFLRDHPQAGAVGPNLRRPDGAPDRTSARRLLSLSAALCMDALRLHALPLIGPRLGRKLAHPYDYDRTQPVEAISGAALLARRELLQNLGGFSETFLHCGEDLDLCFRIRQSGFEIWYVAEARIMHLKGARRGAPRCARRSTPPSATSSSSTAATGGGMGARIDASYNSSRSPPCWLTD